MLVVGAGGLALQMLDDLEFLFGKENLVFWNNQNSIDNIISQQFRVLANNDEVIEYFEKGDPSFIIAVGGSLNRKKLLEQFELLGGIVHQCISPNAKLSNYASLGKGTVILPNVIIEASAIIGTAVLINSGATITHECSIGEYTEIAPAAVLGGRVILGKNVFIGLNATVLPNVTLGDNVIVGAGAVVTRSWENAEILKGIPARNAK